MRDRATLRFYRRQNASYNAFVLRALRKTLLGRFVLWRLERRIRREVARRMAAERRQQREILKQQERAELAATRALGRAA